MWEVAQKLVSTPLFNFQDLKLNTRDIITILKDTLNITSSPLPIPNRHATGVPSNTLERHSINSRVIDVVRNLVISSSMVKLVGSPTSDSTFTYQKGTKNTSFVICYSTKALWITILSTKFLIHFRRWCPVKELPLLSELPLSTTLSQQSKWDIHPKWYFLIQVPNKWLLEFNLLRRWACSIPNYENLWQICTATWRVKKVLVESSDLIAFNFNEGTYQWAHYNWWYYMGTIVVWLNIVCSRKHTLSPTSNKLTTNG